MLRIPLASTHHSLYHTTALENGADIGRVQEWLGHANISTTRMYYRLARCI